MTGSRLAYVALVVSDVEAMAATLTRYFGLPRLDCAVGDEGRTAPVLGIGQSALALFAPGDPFVDGQTRRGVHHIALAAGDPRAAAASAGMATTGDAPRPGLGGARRLLLPPASTAGVITYLSEPFAGPTAGAGLVRRLDHVGVASADNGAAVDAFVRRVGCPLESMQTDLEVSIAVESFTSDKYGAVYHTRAPEPVGGLRVAFVTIGDCELEFLQDFDPRLGVRVEHDRPGTTKQDKGAIAKFVAAHGAGLHHLAFKVDDIDAALARLAAGGLRVIDRTGRPGSRRARIGFIHPASLGGVLVHLVQRDPGG